ncbi:MAG: hypothetical protein R2788_13455 [Saprospiraceae bacterium]|jgi:hypothetical protein
MMNLAIYHSNETVNEILEEFIDAYYGQRMHYFASDLLKEDFTPEEIMTSVRRAMSICRAAGVDVRPHFNLVYTTLEGAIIKDCKLSKFSYALVLLNGPSNNATVADWQVQLVNSFLNK